MVSLIAGLLFALLRQPTVKGIDRQNLAPVNTPLSITEVLSM